MRKLSSNFKRRTFLRRLALPPSYSVAGMGRLSKLSSRYLGGGIWHLYLPKPMKQYVLIDFKALPEVCSGREILDDVS